MKMSKKIRTLVSTALISAMVLTMGGMSAFADTAADLKMVTITKDVTKPADIYLPKTDFQFSISSSTEQTGLKGEDGKALASPVGKVTFVDNKNTVPASPSEADMGETTVEVGTIQLAVTEEGWPAPGVYRYEVTETEGSYPGMNYVTTPKYFDVYVDNTNTAYAYTFVNASDSKAKDGGHFVNSYGEGVKAFHNLTVTKTVTGNQGDKTREFKFTVKVVGEADENYKMVYGKVSDDGEFTTDSTTVVLVSNVAKDITLANGEQAIIYGLDNNDMYTVTEEILTDEGYTTYIDEVKSTTNVATGTIEADKTVAYKNEKVVTTPTGIVMTFGPYVLLIALAGVFATLFFRRKREEF